MTNSRTTRRALLSSVLAIFLCVAMLVGTTFAWFTDTASTAVNKIQAGELKVDIVDVEGNSLEGDTLKFRDVEGSEDILWEPGVTFDLDSFKIVNKGNLALKYNVVINGIDGDAKLLEAIEFTVMKDGANEAAPLDSWDGVLLPAGSEATDGADVSESSLITISGHMKETAGNEYQGLSIEGISITVVATQYTYESDSIDNTYDTDATFLNMEDENTYLISNADELVYFAKTVNVDDQNYEGKTIKLIDNIDLSGYNWIPVGVRSDEGALNKIFRGTFDGNGKSILNMTVKSSEKAGFFGFLLGSVKNLNFYNANVSGNHWGGVVAGYVADSCPNVAITNCSVHESTVTLAAEQIGSSWDNGDKAGGIVGYVGGGSISGGISGCTVTSTTIRGYRDLGGIAGYCGTDVDVKNCVVADDVSIIVDKTHDYKSAEYTSDDMYDANTFVGESHGQIIGCTGSVGSDYVIADGVVLRASGAYDLQNENGLRWLASAVNSGSKFTGKSVTLSEDIDLGGKAWTPIGNDTTPFEGSFDGGNHTISNLNINMADKNSVGFFGRTNLGEVKNIKIKNATVKGHLNVGVLAGTPYTADYSNITLSGLIKVDGYAYVGGLLGKNAYGDITNVTINGDAGSYVNADSGVYRTYVGGVVGFMGEGNQTVSNVTSNLNVTGTTCDVGGITGLAHYGNTFTNCSSSGNVTITDASDANDADELGGIAGVWMNKTSNITFNNCSYTGTLSTNMSVDISNNTIYGAPYYKSGTGLIASPIVTP